jgi:hypothetical protein
MSEDSLKAITDLEDDTPSDRHQELAMIVVQYQDEVIEILRGFGFTVEKKRYGYEVPI